jgi:uncharacterized membrane protein
MTYYALEAPVQGVREKEPAVSGTMTVESASIRQDKREIRSLYVASGAMFIGLIGVYLFAAPGGVIGAILGALIGAGSAQARLQTGA